MLFSTETIQSTSKLCNWLQKARLDKKKKCICTADDIKEPKDRNRNGSNYIYCFSAIPSIQRHGLGILFCKVINNMLNKHMKLGNE